MIEKYKEDITLEELSMFQSCGYVCVDTETTGLNYLINDLCTVQLYSDNCEILIHFDNKVNYKNLMILFMSNSIIKIFHNAVFDVSFIMKSLNMNRFGSLVCTKISSKLINGVEFNNSLKSLLKTYLDVEISKVMQLSDWSQEHLSPEQKEYAMNDVRFLHDLWLVLADDLERKGLLDLAYNCFAFVPQYKLLKDMDLINVFEY